MKKPLPFLFASTLFICGILVGLIANSGTHAQERSTGQSADTLLLTSTLAADTSTSIACLHLLRQGETNVVISVLELHIDSDLVMLADRLSALPRSERDPQHLQIIKMFRDYRAKYPRTNSVAYIQEGITRAYGLLTDTHYVANGPEAINVVLAEIKRRGGDLAHWDFYTRQAERLSEGWYVVAMTNGVPITSYVVSPDGRIISETRGF
jgi:hypothetical protein